jgi:hypothetical protein
MLSNTDPSSQQRSAESHNNHHQDSSWQHVLIQSPSDSSILPQNGISFDPPPPPSPTRVYVSPKCFRRNRSDQQEDFFLSCSKQQQQSYYSTSSTYCGSCPTMSLSSLAIPSLEFPTAASTRQPQEVSLRPRFTYISPPRGVPAVSARERRANVARLLDEALQMMDESYSDHEESEEEPLSNFL